MDASGNEQSTALYRDQVAFLKEMAATYNLPDEHKAMRVLVEYARWDGDRDDIFKMIRCQRCG